MQFITSKYIGDYKFGQMHGKGTFFFSTGTKYVGEIKDGLFHGEGKMILSDGDVYEGIWENGVNISGRYVFRDGLVYQEKDWTYCRYPDRRFQSEILFGWQRGETTYLRKRKENRVDLLLGCIPTEEFIYNPNTREVVDHSGKFLRYADDEEHKFIVMTNKRLDMNAVYPWEDEKESDDDDIFINFECEEEEMVEEEIEETPILKEEKKLPPKKIKLQSFKSIFKKRKK
ncbi:MORN repeat-containing protein 5-like isoform X1 [Centruroides sculpturatus]|uniref:MORN repeat-containing protein 5-like isoform X1 n=2 Tax=Centruroides sculpturatus TaxID=218467 RepID=UPI000C6E1B72|nr:MORN repeat-containing protein 5-like isoform X1 [Centruroides sculpturatus]